MILDCITDFFIVYFGCILIDIIFTKFLHKEIIWKDIFGDMICILYGISASIFNIFNVELNNNNNIIIFFISLGLITYIGHKINKAIGIKDYYTKMIN